jgi:hypothetical protein
MANMLFEMNEWVSHPDRILAVVGGAAICGFGLPWLVQMAVRGWTGQQVPRWIMMTMRVVTGGLAGWLVALWLFSTGGGGLGGGGGFGFGTGNNGDNKPPETAKKDEKKDRKDDDPTQNVTTLYVEVLGEKTLKMIDEKHWKSERGYRLETPSGSRLRTLQEVEEYIKQRAAEKPPLKSLTIVLYDDSPAKNVKRVSDLEEWADAPVVPGSDTRLSVGYERRHRNAPE